MAATASASPPVEGITHHTAAVNGTTLHYLVRSFAAVEMGLAGFGLEALADVTHGGGAWHIGVLAAPGIPELLFAGGGRERAFLAGAAFPSMTAVAGSITDLDYDEFARTYSRPGAWRGAAALYRSMLAEGDEIRALAASSPLAVPVLAVGAGGGPFTEMTMRQVTAGGEVTARQLDGVSHYAAMEAPERLAEVVLEFVRGVESA
ncbi:hypothetical protein B0T26DRAFT_767029 [Lasiosphaeria miniovina]|uniref:Alpha/beta hydrolase n=1 Tax=Lasiosphaeria miniovina TaxID=1954250 RepID=A0AA40B5H7_9PEZI|nr:uncharacterized protein B0T26DRAFT_767029 [Lasiosphaeria miniovina]KAK0728055.1 hypothetical protein B0T26DRAFT_767029 [Lasiosphaeria miniovina]